MLPAFEEPDPQMIEVLRSKTPAELLQIMEGMWRSALDMYRRLLRAEHPEWTEEELQLAVAQ
jgi:hypothetical protein